MKQTWRIITGTAIEVENELNELEERNSSVCIMGMSATNETTTVVAQLFPN